MATRDGALRRYWFEKTVEYKYVVETVESVKSNCLEPFDGNLEKWFGDALAVENGEFKLIEFKRSDEEINDEKTKYRISYESARKEALASFAKGNKFVKGHYIIYGTDQPSEPVSTSDRLFPYLSLKYQDYWQVETCAHDSASMLPFASPEHLREYLKFLQRSRDSDKGTSGGVALVEVKYHGEVRHISVDDFIDAYDVKHSPEPKNQEPPDPDESLSRGMR